MSSVTPTLARDKGKELRAKGNVKHFTDLQAWQMAHQLTVIIYKWTKKFPQDEKFGLISQIRRAAVSIESNLAEGFGRFSPNDKKQFYRTAKTSCLEVECQLIISKDLKYLLPKDFDIGQDLCIQIQQSISGLIKSINSRS